jgi:peptidoglycan biosynthesis protein MviN/MurJ (putative lipid II flippase)
MDYTIKFLVVMFAMILTDVCWTVYFMKVEERKSVSAGIWSALIMLAGGTVTMNYVEDKTLLIAALIGAFIGTAATVEYKRRKEKKNKENGN